MKKEKQIVLECRRPSTGFERSRYREVIHNFSNAIIIPPTSFETLGIKYYSYVEVKPADDQYSESSAVLYAVPFDEEAGPEYPVAAISTNLMEKIHPEVGSHDHIKITPVDSKATDELIVHRAYSGEEQNGCYVHPNVIAEIGVSIGDKVEIFNPVKGGRVITKVQTLYEKDQDRSKIRLDLHLAEVLDVEFGGNVKIRPYVNDATSANGFIEKIQKAVRWGRRLPLDFLVGSREIHLKVERGEVQDEERGIVRLSESTRQYLGVDVKDKLIISWKGNVRTVQCLEPQIAVDDQPNNTLGPHGIAVPSSLRDSIGVSPGDAVSVKRHTWFIFQKEVAISTIGILGVVFGTFQVMNTTGWTPILIEQFGRMETVILLLGLSGVISIPVLFLLFLPTRSEV